MTPMTPKFLPLSEPCLRGNEWGYVKECLDTGWISSAGPFVSRFEDAVASYVGAPHAVAVVNGTAAIHLALTTLGIRPGDEVIVSTLTFIASVNAIQYAGAVPVFMDADPATYQMDAGKLARFLATECEQRDGACFNRRSGRRVRAIVPVHILGLACDIERIVAVAREHGIAVMEDAAEAMGVRVNGRHAGTFGDIGIFSFNGNKIITTGGGGILATANADLARHAKYLSTQAKNDELEYVHHEIGFNYRLTNIQAAIGLAQMEQLDAFVAERRATAAAYTRGLAGVPGLRLMTAPRGVDATFWLYTVLMPEGTTLERRKAVLRALHERGVGARPLWHPIHALPPYRACQAFEVEHAPDLYARAVSLPSSAGMAPEDLQRCIDAMIQEVKG